MRIVLVRYSQKKTITRGILQVIENDVCVAQFHSLELGWNDNKTGISCVPAGTYTMKFEHSPAFKRDLWELKGVPNRSETKIHPANQTSELRGCIAIAYSLSSTGVLDSKRAVDDLHALTKKIAKQELEIQIITV